MKNKLTLLLGLLFAGIFSANAQGGQGNGQGFQRRTVEERVKGIMERISDSLKLTKEELPGTEAAFTDYYKAQDKLREGLQPGERPDRSQFEKLMADRDEALKKVWTEAQFKQFKEVLEPNMRRPRGDRPTGQ